MAQQVSQAKDAMASLDGDMLAVNGDTGPVNGDIKADSEHIERIGHGESANGQSNGAPKEPVICDVVVVGAGFSGIAAIHRFRKLGMKVKAFESGSDFGGVWYWNRYPGARVDSEAPFYQLNIPEVYRAWNFSERFPDHRELREYMAHVDKVLGLRKDVEFNAQVMDASWDAEQGRWTIKTNAGHTATCKYLILATGLLHRKYIPDFPGLDEYKGALHHSGFWPEGKSMKGKKVAIIGAGATAVQITQELGKEAEELTVFMRRPSYCLPMQQRPLSKLEQAGWKTYLPALFADGRNSRAGFPGKPQDCGVFDVSDEVREGWFEDLWARGGFNYQLANFNDVLLNKKSNRAVYDFWAKKTRERMTDPKKRELMAPQDPPYYYGTKRNPLEMDYYEVLDRPNVDIVDLNKTPLKSFAQKGMVMADDQLREFDVVVLATGFDSFTGSLTNMGLKNKDGVDLREVWKDGVWTYLGLTISGFPNMFMSYTPQAPTALSNGPTILECQLDTIAAIITKLEKEGLNSIEATHSAEIGWKDMLSKMNEGTLFPFTSSWWTGGNIPGKKAENMTYIGGIDNYEKQCLATLDEWKGFEVK